VIERAEVWFHLLLALSVGTVICVTVFGAHWPLSLLPFNAPQSMDCEHAFTKAKELDRGEGLLGDAEGDGLCDLCCCLGHCY
jgi:hypothetical protein